MINEVRDPRVVECLQETKNIYVDRNLRVVENMETSLREIIDF